MAPVLVAPKIIFQEAETKCFAERERKIAMVDIRRKNGNGIGSGYEVIGIFGEIIEHRKCGNESTENKYEDMFPKSLEEVLIREDGADEEYDEDEWGKTKGNISMQTETEDDATPKE